MKRSRAGGCLELPTEDARVDVRVSMASYTEVVMSLKSYTA